MKFHFIKILILTISASYGSYLYSFSNPWGIVETTIKGHFPTQRSPVFKKTKENEISLPSNSQAQIVKPFGRDGFTINEGIDLLINGEVIASVTGDLLQIAGRLEITNKHGFTAIYEGVDSNQNLVKKIKRGEVLGYARLLHFELRDKNNFPLNPVNYFAATLALPKKDQLSLDSVLKVLKVSGWPNSEIKRMSCVAYFESGWNRKAKNVNKNGTQDTGLLQINDSNLDLCKVTRTHLLDPLKNARCGLKIFKSQGLNAWVAYKKHKKLCDRSQTDGFKAL